MQNEEQATGSTLWARIQQRKGPELDVKDKLYLEYSKDEFKDILVNKNSDPELYEFVSRAQGTGLQFSKYSEEQLEKFIDKIYELRKN